MAHGKELHANKKYGQIPYPHLFWTSDTTHKQCFPHIQLKIMKVNTMLQFKPSTDLEINQRK